MPSPLNADNAIAASVAKTTSTSDHAAFLRCFVNSAIRAARCSSFTAVLANCSSSFSKNFIGVVTC